MIACFCCYFFFAVTSSQTQSQFARKGGKSERESLTEAMFILHTAVVLCVSTDNQMACSLLSVLKILCVGTDMSTTYTHTYRNTHTHTHTHAQTHSLTYTVFFYYILFIHAAVVTCLGQSSCQNIDGN